ncbi:hypothetical protein ACFYW6_34140 [Streptomyces sp. NPDC002659]|uniref:hypothetical protein n=1 Tax=Streptomyces sp. NPDC002659 TaxID=3364656 RepID=UPI0036AADCB0
MTTRAGDNVAMGDASALAAWAAAATSLATLTVTTIVGGRRDQRRWAREALTDAFVHFLEASWRHSDAVGALAAESPVDPNLVQSDYAEMRSQLTRLRLLASDRVLQAGEELLRRQRELERAEPANRREALVRVSTGRRKVVDCAKRDMGLP